MCRRGRENSVLCNVSRSEVENGAERRPGRCGRSPADLQPRVDTESDPSESRRRPASMRWMRLHSPLCGCSCTLLSNPIEQ